MSVCGFEGPQGMYADPCTKFELLSTSLAPPPWKPSWELLLQSNNLAGQWGSASQSREALSPAPLCKYHSPGHPLLQAALGREEDHRPRVPGGSAALLRGKLTI